MRSDFVYSLALLYYTHFVVEGTAGLCLSKHGPVFVLKEDFYHAYIIIAY